MTDCQALREHLKAYLDGELPLWRRAVVRRHLAACAACREEATVMEEIGSELRAGETAEMSAALRSRILAGIPVTGTEEPGEPDTAPAPRPVWRQPLVLWGAAATVVICWFVLVPALAPSHDMAQQVARAPATSPPAELPGPSEYHRMADRGAGITDASARSESPASPGGSYLAGPAAAYQAKARMQNSAPGTAAGLAPAATRYVLKEAAITVEVADIEENSATVEQMTRDAGGFVERNSLSTGPEGSRTASLALRVPTGRFEETLKKVAKLGSVASKDVKGQDRTDEVTDERQASEALKQSVRDAESRLRRAGQSSANEMTVAALRVQLAQARGRLENLQKLTAMSTISVELREKSKTHVNGGGFIDEMGDTGRSAVNSFLYAARVPVLAFIWILAYSPLWVPLAIAYRYAARAQRRRVAVREAREWNLKRSEGAAT